MILQTFVRDQHLGRSRSRWEQVWRMLNYMGEDLYFIQLPTYILESAL